jgi:hypothetical protein
MFLYSAFSDFGSLPYLRSSVAYKAISYPSLGFNIYTTFDSMARIALSPYCAEVPSEAKKQT